MISDNITHVHIITNIYIENIIVWHQKYFCNNFVIVILKLNSRLYVREKIDQNDAINNVSQAH